MCRWPHFRPSLEGGGEQAVGAVEVEDARDVATNRAADASAESGEAGAADVSAVGAPGEEPAAIHVC